jgi:hypothetical protein
LISSLPKLGRVSATQFRRVGGTTVVGNLRCV